MAGIEHYRDLVVWQRAMDVVDQVYDVAAAWPDRERYGLIGQAQRAAVSIPANIAEGQGRTGSREFLHHLSIANGSLHELEPLLQIAQRRRYPTSEECYALLAKTAEVGRLLGGLKRRLRASLSDH